MVRELSFDGGHYFSILAGIDLFRENPIVGIGFGHSYEHSLRWAIARHGHKYFFAPHNDYVRLLAECGLLGFILGIGAACQLLLLFRRLLAKEIYRPIQLLMLGILTQVIAVALSQANQLGVLSYPQWAFPMGAIVAAVLGAIWMDNEQPASE